ncbi:DUF2062 domain-containing protein [Psychrobium sp. 1_MG-2023]|uniref:DUF2062 domain-containing protein n=1 Tax=Psychrobium sp. 1_MG-2023 TaxID=3062624 RepID=UPI000C34E92D|nr:DUF2062 domain-containing protein [Psychrobium sp. 1_MG-2023]MDP2560284.1 DUF2062 domain-containing protein [Psychrobium sp. 1_MG-2023]PKF55401.1 DUF2062 domain-containing protein [Alteromonadales bacterium alter-6D02]
MPRKTIKRMMPDHQKIKEHKHLRHLGSRLHDPNLWHLNRRSASGAFAVGLFFAWMPVPMQMLLAAFSAVFFRVNLPLSVVLVWISNPITMPPMFYGAYLLGAKIMGVETQEFSFEISIEWLVASVSTIGPPFLLGCVIVGAISSLLGYTIIRLLWRASVVKEMKQRQNRK